MQSSFFGGAGQGNPSLRDLLQLRMRFCGGAAAASPTRGCERREMATTMRTVATGGTGCHAAGRTACARASLGVEIFLGAEAATATGTGTGSEGPE